MVSKGLCSRHKAIRSPSNGQRYLIGQKRYQVYQIFIDCDGVFAPDVVIY
jgi:hypothetical protein